MKRTLKNKSDLVKEYIENQQHSYYVKEDNNRDLPFDFILSKMNDDSKRIIYCDYVVIQEKDWYLKFYSKSTYYRLKHIALDEFISVIESI